MNRLPDFFIIGASRSGTNSLRVMLNSVPEILPAKKREIHFFDKDSEYSQGLKHYESYFLEREVHLSFDTTPNYLYSEKAPIRIKKDMPEQSYRFIVLLRNPIDRAWSNYWHWKDKIPKSELFNPDSELLKRGRYIDYLKRWMSVFGQKCFIIIKSERFFEQPVVVANSIIDLFGLSRIQKALYYDPKKSKPIVKSSYPDPDKKTFNFLREYYRKPNEELYDYLGIDLALE